MPKIGLFFGSFNPIHIGHLQIAKYFYSSEHLDEIWYILSPQNPFKKLESLAPTLIRKKMLEASIKSPKLRSFLKLVTLEMERPPPHYTYDTLHYLLKQYPNHQFYLIIGEDNAISLEKWYRGDWIKKHCKILSYPRRYSGIDNRNTREPPHINISATEIRNRVKRGLSISKWVTPEVEKIIREEKLYLT